MELDRIDKLLEAYFEGATDLDEEAALFDYFNNQQVADHLLPYKPIFVGLSAARKESSTREFSIGKEPARIIKSWWYGVAAMAVVSIGIGSFYFSQPQI